MVLDDRHILYLREVALEHIRLWSPYKGGPIRYVNVDWASGRKEVDQKVAAQMKALGMTIVRKDKAHQLVILTPRGESVLAEEDEAWA